MSKTKRLLSLVLALLMSVALFAGVSLATDATATDAQTPGKPIGTFTESICA